MSLKYNHDEIALQDRVTFNIDKSNANTMNPLSFYRDDKGSIVAP